MKDNPVAELNRLINRCSDHFVEGVDLRIPETGIEWQGRADQLLQEARALVKEWSPDDTRLRNLSPYPSADLPPGSPWWTPPLGLGIASLTSSALCEANNPVSYHLALLNCLKEIVKDWRLNPPEKPIAATKRGRQVHGKSLEERGDDWAHEQLKQPRRTYRAVARDISAEQDVDVETVLREARKSRERRGTAG